MRSYPHPFSSTATPRSANSQRDPPNRSTGLAAFFSSQGPHPAQLPAYSPPSHPHDRDTTWLSLESRRGGSLGLENCPRKLGRSQLRTVTNSGAASTFASASSPVGWLGIAAACSPSTTLEPVLPRGPYSWRWLLCVLAEAKDEATKPDLGDSIELCRFRKQGDTPRLGPSEKVGHLCLRLLPRGLPT